LPNSEKEGKKEGGREKKKPEAKERSPHASCKETSGCRGTEGRKVLRVEQQEIEVEIEAREEGTG
jgi:hypothetical protein